MKDFSELNVGDVCFIRAQVREVKKDAMHFDTIDENGKLLLDWSFALCDSEYNSILTADDLQQEGKPTHNEEAEENKPKYDPCRLFRKGDKVRVVEWHGRKPEAEDKLYTVHQDERPGCTMVDIGPNDAGGSSFYTACFLELVMPVEERVSFRVGDFPVNGEWSVWKNSFRKTEIVSSYKIDTHPNAKAAAEAECARLNEEWRKEVQA